MLGGGKVGSAWYELELKDQGFLGELRAMETQLRQAGETGERAFGTELERGIDEATSAADKLDRELGEVDQTTKGIGGTLTGAAKGGAAFGAGLLGIQLGAEAVTQALDFAGKAVGLASDKAEAASKAQILFGDSYGIIEKASAGAAESVGLSSTAYLAAAGDVGNLVVNFGIAGDEAANMSKDIVSLAADMGSFNNASTAEVTEAIGAAFRGETEPIRRFGVMLDAASVSAKAVAMGLAETNGPLTASAKLQASYALILEQTGKAQGDFARTSDGFANSQRIAAAKQEEAMTKLGEAIMPLAGIVMPALAEAGVAVIGVLTDLFGVAAEVGIVLRDLNELWKPWEKEARLAREEAQLWADELEKMPESAGKSRKALESIATGAQSAGTGIAGATEELIDMARWSEALASGTSGLPGMVRNFEQWSEWVDKGTLSAEAFDRKVRAMVNGGLSELSENLDLLPPALAAVVDGIASGDDAVARFIVSWKTMGSQMTHGEIPRSQWVDFLIANTELIREHFAELPKHIQEAMIAAGIVARAEIGNSAGTIAQVYQARLVNSMQGFWTGAGQQFLSPPKSAVDQAQEALEQLIEDFEELGGANPASFEQYDAQLQLIAGSADVVIKNWAKLPPAIQQLANDAGIVLEEAGGAFAESAGAFGEGAISALNTAGWAEAIRNPVRRGTAGAIHAIEGLGGGLQEQLKSAEQGVKEAMADLRWAIANPGAWAKTLRTVENAIEDSEVRQAAFLRAGNAQAAALEEANQSRLVGIWEETTRQGYRAGQRLTTRRTSGMQQNADEGPKLWRRLTAEEKTAMLALVPVAGRAGSKTSGEYADGTKGNAGKAPATWSDMTAKQRRYMTTLMGQTRGFGGNTVGGYGDGIAGGKERPGALTRGMTSDVRFPMVSLIGQASGYGSRTVSAYAGGIAAGRAAAVAAGQGVVRAVGGVFAASSPPTSPLNPMREIATWGRRTMEAYGDGFEAAGPGVAARAARALGPLSRAFDAQAGGLSLGVMGELKVRHEIDLRNAPPGLTNAGVASMIQDPDATIYLRNLRQAELLPGAI